MFRLQLLNNLCEEHPNAYVSIGEKYYYPTRSELFNFEMFRLAKKANMYKSHEGLPIILTLEEYQHSIYEEFEEYLIFGTPLNLANLNQIEVILFLKRICSDEEIRNVLRASASPLGSAIYDIFSIDTWLELTEYGLDPVFLDEYERIQICVAIHRGTYDFKEKWSFNYYGKQLLEINPENLERTNPLLFKALKFYKISFQRIKDKYPYRDPYNNNSFSN